jgi:hypothetical protein
MFWMLLGCLLAPPADPAPAQAPAPTAVTLAGRVVPLAEALPASWKVDAGPIAGQVVLKGEAGEVVPLLSDEASRALFADERLRGRPIRIQARRLAGLPYVQVTSFQVEEEGTFRTPEYYCDICTISVRYPQVCPCCQGPMELRMKPEAP